MEFFVCTIDDITIQYTWCTAILCSLYKLKKIQFKKYQLPLSAHEQKNELLITPLQTQRKSTYHRNVRALSSKFPNQNFRISFGK